MRTGVHAETYNTWVRMRQRCTNPNDPKYYRYGARGITICERWNEYENFLADMGEKPPHLSLDRKNNDGNYEPNNCRWGTHTEQAENRSSTRFTREQAKQMIRERLINKRSFVDIAEEYDTRDSYVANLVYGKRRPELLEEIEEELKHVS